MANPRVEELRSRLQREPGSRLFAQLAEELRKDGDLAEAIRVAKSGLALHPNYPSARLTLGRALIESGDLPAARSELESVLRGAPDNIMASRMLAECLEGLGDHGAALLQFRAALRLSPGDRQIEGQIRALEQRLASPPLPRPGPPAAPSVALAPPVPPAGLPREAPAARVDSGATLPSMKADGGAAAGAASAEPPRPPLVTPPVAPPPAASAPPAPSVKVAPSASPAPVVAEAPTPATVPGGDFEDVFEATPSWQVPSGPPSPSESSPILLLEDEAPTLPGGPLGKAAGASVPLAGEPQARPDTAAFPALPVSPGPVAQSFVPEPERPWSPEEPPTSPPIGNQTLAGTPAFAPSGPSPAEPAPQSPFGPPGGEAAPLAPSSFQVSAHMAEPPTPFAPVGPSEVPAPEPPLVPQASPGAAPALRSATLAELYLEQGFPEKALEVYEQLLESDPYDERARGRLIEIKRMAATRPAAAFLAERREVEAPSAPPAEPALPTPLPDPHEPRRRALQRTIARLEEMLLAVRRA